MSQILLIEPDSVLAQVCQQAFERKGWSAIWAPQAQAAIGAADLQTPDAIVMELQLSGHSGIEFLYEFRSYPEWRHVPVIIHSLVPPTEFSDLSLLSHELGIEAYYYKPVTKITQLVNHLQQYLGSEQ